MKKRMVLFLALGFFLAWTAQASAAELKARGEMHVEGIWMDNWDFRSMKHGAVSEDDFEVVERARIQFEFIANENLKGVVQLQIGDSRWGNGGFALGQGDSDPGLNTSLRTKEAYLTFNIPDTSVNISGGYLGVALPSSGTTGNRILDTETAALSVFAPVIEDRLSILALYSRAIDLNLDYGIAADDADGMTPKDDEYDLFVLGLPVTLEGFNITPYGAYGHAGKDALNGSETETLLGLTPAYANQDLIDAGILEYTKNADTWWGGLAFEMTLFDPINVQFDFAYGAVDTGANEDNDLANRSGWYLDFSLTYDGLDMVRPKLYFAYGSGDDDDISNGSERLPYLNAGGHGFGSFYYGYGSYGAASDMSDGVLNDSGQWIIGLGLEQITFLERLTHDIFIMYVQGTNDHKFLEDNSVDGVSLGDIVGSGAQWGYYLTDKDYLLELDLNTQYEVYEELTAFLELGAILAHFDDDVWNIEGEGDNAYKVSLGLQYCF